MIAWAVTIGMLVRDHRVSSKIATPEIGSGDFFGSVSPAEKWQDIEEWMLLVQSREGTDPLPIGASHTAIRRTDDPTTTSAYTAEFAIQGKISPLLPEGFVKGIALLDKNENLTSFSLIADLGMFSLSSQAEIVNSTLFVKITKPNGIRYYKRHLDQPVSFSGVLRPSLARHIKIAPGEKMLSPVLDPLTGKNRGTVVVRILDKEMIELDGEQVPAYRVTSSLGDVTTTMWMDAEGRTLRRALVNNLRMDRTDRATALEHGDRLEEAIAAPPLDLTEFANVTESSGKPETDDQASGLLGLILQ